MVDHGGASPVGAVAALNRPFTGIENAATRTGGVGATQALNVVVLEGTTSSANATAYEVKAACEGAAIKFGPDRIAIEFEG